MRLHDGGREQQLVRPERAAADRKRHARKRGNCPFKRKTRRYPTAKTVDRFERLFKRRGLRPRTRITIRVTAPGVIGLFVRYTTRAGKRPRRVQRCLRPGTTRPVRC